MSTLELNHVYKTYPNGVKAVNDFCLKAEDGEFIVFVGPSGCGKSTTLRMIAGLEEITLGDIRIDGQIVNDLEPKERDIAMVFQNYALYPHMTVYDNIAFGLKLKHLPKEEIDKKVKDAAEILGLTEYLKRKPKAMSGGQRQRVALGRAIVREPKIFLLDEPLSNLDAKLRASMRGEIAKLHNRLKTTFVYVTHDQVEAMTLGTRVVVMKDGFVQQIDTPRYIYRFPANKFVAGFIGTPQMNFFFGSLKKEGDKVRISFKAGSNEFVALKDLFAKVNPFYLKGDKDVIFGLRPEHVSIDPNKYEWKAKVKVNHVEEFGVETEIYGSLNLDSDEEEGASITIKGPTGVSYEAGEIIEVSLGLNHLKMFDAKTELAINPKLPASSVLFAEAKNGKINLDGSLLSLPAALQIEDGNYEVEIPNAAVKEGNEIQGTLLSKEPLTETFSCILKLPSGYLSFEGDKNFSKKPGEKCSLRIAWKKCRFISKDKTYEPVSNNNVLKAKIIKNSLMVKHHDENGKEYERKECYCELEVAGVRLLTSKEMGYTLLSLREKKIVKEDIEIRFSEEATSFGEEGIPCEVTSVKDYGDEKLVLANTSEGTILVSSSKAPSLGPNHLVIDLDKVEAYDPVSGYRLV